tara:strand:+ start:3447 stop:5393 length:1947 start_codon:yes stop_codon:yes gene_type:complete
MKNSAIIIIFSLFILSCSKTERAENSFNSDLSISEANFPKHFDFSTHQVVKIQLSESNNTVFKIYGQYQNEKDLISSGSVVQGEFFKDLKISSHYESLLIERWKGSAKSSNIYSLNGLNTSINSFSLNKGKTQNSNDDILYAINSGGNFFSINLSDYSITTLPNPMAGSIALAVDTVKNRAYYYKFPKMYAYDINTGVHSLHASYTSPFNGNYPRLEYNHNDGYLYTSNNSQMKVIDPDNGALIRSSNIEGIVNTNGGGDLAFPPNGKTYLSCFSGLYELDMTVNPIQATRLSAENFPFKLTSLGYDRNNFLYAGTNESNSRLIKIDPADGSYLVVKTFSHALNDLGSVVMQESSLNQVDTDGDGVIDELDEEPNDPNIAHAEYTPSVLGNGSLGFEDLWPAEGDYDFNDLVVRYRFIKYLNAENKMIKLKAQFQIKAIGASMHNGFGIELACDPSVIESVSGSQISKGLVNLDAKGIESGISSKTSIIVFDDAFDNINFPGGGIYVNTEKNAPSSVGDTITIIVKFNQLVDSDAAGDAPFNPFIFINGDRSKEVHLADQEPTSKANSNLFGSGDDDSQPGNSRYYRSSNNAPWAINISHEFRHPIEKVRIDEAYNYFVNWAVSGGSNYGDWYKDNQGYRNTEKLFLN